MEDRQSYAIIGACMEVHRQLGCGFLEHVYQLALAKELTLQGIPFVREMNIPIFYKGEELGTNYKADFVCYGDIIVELKAVSEMSSICEAQVIHYLRATRFKRALLFNFGVPSLVYRRLVLDWRS